MKHAHRFLLSATVLATCAIAAGVATRPAAAATPAHTQPIRPAPKAGPRVDRTLIAMANASTWGHPDQFYEYAGMRAYARGDYRAAIDNFKHAARYADKFSQLALGLMYANGRGVAKDPVRACAWLGLASQAHAPSFIATRDRVCKALTRFQHDQAVAALEKLLPVYGDKVAVRRMAQVLNRGKMDTTGSRLGFDSGINYVPATEFPLTNGEPEQGGGGGYPDTRCTNSTIVGATLVPVAGCGNTNFWITARWNPKRYFTLRRRHWLGVVTAGPLQTIQPPAPASEVKPAPNPIKP